MITQELMEEAMKRYPIGTVFQPAHIKNETDHHTLIGYRPKNTCINSIVCLSTGGYYEPCLYHEGKWAELIATNDYSIF